MIREIVEGQGWQFPFVMYRPETITANLPLIVQLHGAGEVGNGGTDLDKVEIHGLSHLLEAGEEYPCMFVFPQCPPESFWVAEISNIHAFIQKLILSYQLDAKRIYLTGLSMGGYGTWYTALRYPEMFAAIAPICGGGMVWRAGVLDMPVWAFHGSEDGVVYPSETMNMIHKIRMEGSNQSEVKMTIFDGVEHNSWVGAYTPTLVEWLLSKKRS